MCIVYFYSYRVDSRMTDSEVIGHAAITCRSTSYEQSLRYCRNSVQRIYMLTGSLDARAGKFLDQIIERGSLLILDVTTTLVDDADLDARVDTLEGLTGLGRC